jgi:hypothetical protein
MSSSEKPVFGLAILASDPVMLTGAPGGCGVVTNVGSPGF